MSILKKLKNKYRYKEGERFKTLDGLRGFAAVSVLLYHCTTRYNQLYGHSDNILFLFRGGYGVSLFLMLSGFLNMHMLEKKKSTLDWFTGRLIRIYPSYIIASVIIFIIVRICGLPGREVADIKQAFYSLSAMHVIFDLPHIDGAFWAIQIILFFYCWLAIFHILKCRKLIMLFFTAITLIQIMDRRYGILPANIGVYRHLFLIEFAYLFLIGLIIYNSKMHFRWYYVVSIVICLIAVRYKRSDYQFWSIIIISVLLYAGVWIRIPVLSSKLFIYLGSISYFLYLIHQNIGYVILRFLYRMDINANIATAITIAWALITAALMTKYVDIPITCYLRRKYYTIKDYINSLFKRRDAKSQRIFE